MEPGGLIVELDCWLSRGNTCSGMPVYPFWLLQIRLGREQMAAQSFFAGSEVQETTGGGHGTVFSDFFAKRSYAYLRRIHTKVSQHLPLDRFEKLGLR